MSSEATDEADFGWLHDGPRGVDAFNDMAATLSGDGLLTPPVPAGMAEQLMTTRDGWAWGTADRWDPWIGYLGLDGANTLSCLEPSVPDFWLYAHRGHGIGSWGIGLVCKVGPLVVAHQNAYGGFFGSGDPQTLPNVSTRAWSNTLTKLETLNAQGPARYLVAYSDYRRVCMLATSSPEFRRRSPSSADSLLPSDWTVLVDHPSAEGAEHLRQLSRSDNAVLAVAATHLSELLAGEFDRRGHAAEFSSDDSSAPDTSSPAERAWTVDTRSLAALGATTAWQQWVSRLAGDRWTPEAIYGPGGSMPHHFGRPFPTAEALRTALLENMGGGVPIEVIDALVQCCNPDL